MPVRPCTLFGAAFAAVAILSSNVIAAKTHTPATAPTTQALRQPTNIIPLPINNRGVLVSSTGHSIFVDEPVTFANAWPVVLYYWPEAIGAATGLIALISAGRVLRQFRRQRRTLGEPYCRKCGYQLTALVSSRCPECGTDLAAGDRIIARRISLPMAIPFTILTLSVAAYPLLRAFHVNRQPPKFLARFDWPTPRAAVWIRDHHLTPLTPQVKSGVHIVEIDVATARVIRAFSPVAGHFQRTVLAPDNNNILASNRDTGRIIRWNLQTGKPAGEYASPQFTCYPCVDDFTMDEKYVYGLGAARARTTHSVLRWNLQNGAPVSDLGHTKYLGAFAACPASGRLLILSDAARFYERETGTTQTSGQFDSPGTPVNWSGIDGPYFCTLEAEKPGGAKFTVRNSRLELLQTLPVSDDLVERSHITFSADRRLAATSAEIRPSEITIYNLKNSLPVATLAIPAIRWNDIRSIQLSADGHALVARCDSPRDVALIYNLEDLSPGE